MKVLMDVQELRDRMNSGARTVLLDVRWSLGDPHGHEHYRAAHLPGAVFVDLEAELCSPGGPGLGRHPLPATAALQEAARRWGLDDGDTVVAYDDSGNLAAARLWWLLRDAGVASVTLLDGGLAAWRAAGFDVEGGESGEGTDGGAGGAGGAGADGGEGGEGIGALPRAGNVRLSSRHMPVVSVADLLEPGTADVVLDARAGERFRGEQEPVDPKAGHIPGAVSAPTSDNLAADGRFRSAEDLRGRFDGLGAGGAGAAGNAGVADSSGVAVYCGSGITAAHQIAALEIAGIHAALFPGSWSQWSTTDGLPVATGP